MDNHNGEEEIARVLTEMPKPPLKQRALRIIAGIGAAIAFPCGLWFLCRSSAAKEITAFIADGNGYVAGFLVLLGIGCAIMAAGAARKGENSSLIFVPFACAGCVIGALQVGSMALIFIVIAFFIGVLWVISNIRISSYYKEAMEDYHRVQYELEKYKEDYRYLVRAIEKRENNESEREDCQE